MNILNCTACFPDYVQGSIAWPPFQVPSLLPEAVTSVPVSIFFNYNTYVYPIFNSVTVVPELSTVAMLLVGLAAIVILKCFKR